MAKSTKNNVAEEELDVTSETIVEDTEVTPSEDTIETTATEEEVEESTETTDEKVVEEEPVETPEPASEETVTTEEPTVEETTTTEVEPPAPVVDTPVTEEVVEEEKPVVEEPVTEEPVETSTPEEDLDAKAKKEMDTVYIARYCFSMASKRLAIKKNMTLHDIYKTWMTNRTTYIAVTSINDFIRIKTAFTELPVRCNGGVIGDVSKQQFLLKLRENTDYAVVRWK